MSKNTVNIDGEEWPILFEIDEKIDIAKRLCPINGDWRICEICEIHQTYRGKEIFNGFIVLRKMINIANNYFFWERVFDSKLHECCINYIIEQIKFDKERFDFWVRVEKNVKNKIQ